MYNLHMKFNHAVATRIKQLLKREKITQYRLAKNTGTSLRTMSYIMNSEDKNLSTKTLLAICKGLNISVQEFFNNPLFKNKELE